MAVTNCLWRRDVVGWDDEVEELDLETVNRLRETARRHERALPSSAIPRRPLDMMS